MRAQRSDSSINASVVAAAGSGAATHGVGQQGHGERRIQPGGEIASVDTAHTSFVVTTSDGGDQDNRSCTVHFGAMKLTRFGGVNIVRGQSALR
jgi:hypothetical protein